MHRQPIPETIADKVLRYAHHTVVAFLALAVAAHVVALLVIIASI